MATFFTGAEFKNSLPSLRKFQSGTFIMSERGENQEDLDLVAKFKATGDNCHFETLFDRYQKRVFSIAFAIFQNREMAEDLVQETFVRAFDQIASFRESDPQSNFSAWLCRICRNACFDEMRKSQVRTQYQRETLLAKTHEAVRGGMLDGDEFNMGGSSYRAQDAEVIFRQVDEELKTIPEERRACWLLFYVEGYSYKEIADKAGLSFEEVKTHIQAVNRHLKRKFK